MNAQLLGTFTPTTLAAMAADLSQELASEWDGALSNYEWDAMKAELDKIVAALVAIVGDEYLDMLQEAGADPDVIMEGVPA